jgi:hypothetical protein
MEVQRRFCHAGLRSRRKICAQVLLLVRGVGGFSTPGRGMRSAPPAGYNQPMRGSKPVNPASSGVKLTYDDFVLLPDDGKRHEIIEGQHYVTPSPNTKHQRVSLNLILLIGGWLEGHPTARESGSPWRRALTISDEIVREHGEPVLASAVEQASDIEWLDCLIDAGEERVRAAPSPQVIASSAHAHSSGPKRGWPCSRKPGASSGRPNRRAASL